VNEKGKTSIKYVNTTKTLWMDFYHQILQQGLYPYLGRALIYATPSRALQTFPEKGNCSQSNHLNSCIEIA
jgi:hypothetical protein